MSDNTKLNEILDKLKKLDDIDDRLKNVETLLKKVADSVSHENADEFPVIRRQEKDIKNGNGKVVKSK